MGSTSGQQASPQYPAFVAEATSAEYARMRRMLTDLLEHGPNLFTCRAFTGKNAKPLLDGTNNVTERAIGWCGKVRYRHPAFVAEATSAE